MLAQRDNTNNDSSSSSGGGLIRTPREGGGGFLGIPFGQPPQQQQPAPSFPGRISTNYGKLKKKFEKLSRHKLAIFRLSSSIYKLWGTLESYTFISVSGTIFFRNL